MPNYSLVAGVTYDPLTYQEIAVPVKEAAAYHQALQDKYDELELNSAMYDALIPKDDPEYALTRSMYDKYYSTLGSGADALTKNGGWGQNDVFSDVRKSFGKYMMPIAKAYARRTAEDDEQRKAKAANPFLEFSRDAKTSGLDYYINHPDGGYETMDTSKVASMTGTMAQQIKAQLRNPAFQESLKQLGVSDEYIALVAEYGATPQMINNWATDPILRPIVKRALNAQGMDIDDNGNPIGNGSFNKDQITKAISAGVSGLYMAIGEDKVQFQQNPNWLLNAELLKQQASAAAKDKDKALDYGRPNEHTITVDNSLTNQGEIDKIINAAAALGYGNENGKIVNRNITKAEGLADGVPGAFRDLLPGKSASTIIDDICKKNGWYRRPGLGRRGSNWIFKDKAHKIPVTDDEIVASLNAEINLQSGTFHTLEDITLTDYNQSFKSQMVYPVTKLNKNGTFNTDHDNGKTIGTILKEAADSIQASVSMTKYNQGIMITVTNGGKPTYYFVKADDLRDANLRANFATLRRRAQDRADEKKRRRLSNEEYYRLLPDDESLRGKEYDYNTALLGVQGSIGSSNSVSNINLFGD